jgi:hypothetical protein
LGWFATLSAGEIMPDGHADGGIKVMEHRQPPRIAPSDRQFEDSAQQTGGRFRLRRFDEDGNHRKIDYRRAGVLVGVGLAVASGFLYLADRARRASLGWLANQPQYQIPFDRIELVHEPPPWYEGGPRAFLKGVRLGSREPDHVSVLDATPDDLRLAFKKYAWVAEVTKVAYEPGRVRVELRYRQPVAWVQLQDAGYVMVDEEATILPSDNIDMAALGRVISIQGEPGLAPPSATQFGEKWKSKANASGLEQVDERILAAAKLAAFLLRGPQTSDAERSQALRMNQIYITTDFDARGLFVRNGEKAAIRWGKAPGSESPGEHSAEEKWAILRDWAETTRARFLEPQDFWAFSKAGLQFRCPHRDSPHAPKESSAPRPANGADAQTKSPG